MSTAPVSDHRTHPTARLSFVLGLASVVQTGARGSKKLWREGDIGNLSGREVIDAISRFYSEDYSNIHRAAHTLAARATDAYEKAREKVQT